MDILYNEMPYSYPSSRFVRNLGGANTAGRLLGSTSVGLSVILAVLGAAESLEVAFHIRSVWNDSKQFKT